MALLLAAPLSACSRGAPSSAPPASGTPASSAGLASSPALDAGRVRLRALLAETDRALDEHATAEELERTLDALGERLVADAAIPSAAIEAELAEREDTNRRAASHGPVPYPSPATAARIFGVPNRLARALARRRDPR